MACCSKSTAFALLTFQAVIVLIVAYLTTSSTTSPWSLRTPSFLSSVILSGRPAAAQRVFARNSTAPPRGAVGIESFPDLLSLYGVQKLSAPQIPRAVTASDYRTLMRLLDLATRVLDRYNVSYVLTYGSLIGSYVMHDLLPWDDDVDVFIDNSTKAKVMDIFRNDSHYGIQGYHYHQSSGQIFKLFFNTSKKAGKYSWNWPFIDIVSYTERGNNIIPVERVAGSRFNIPKSSFYPFHKRPFGPLWLNAPHDPAVLLRSKYKFFYCRSGFWNHQKESERATLHVPCSKLKQYYPFVKRTKLGNRTEETLVLNDIEQYKVVIDETYHQPRSTYGRYGW